MGAKELGPALGGVRGGVGRRHKVFHDVDEALGVVELGEVAGVLEDLQPAAWHGLLGGVRVVDGQYGVALAPDDQGRHVLGEVEAVACVYKLTTRPYDPAQDEENPAITPREYPAGRALVVCLGFSWRLCRG